jgi:DNA-binding CsgD family transcriptional regulator
MSSRRWSEQDRDQIIRMTAEGVSRESIAKRLKTSVSSLRRHFPDLLNHKAGGSPTEFSDTERASAIAMASYGIPQREIAGVLKCSLTTLKKRLGDDMRAAPTQANANVARALYRNAVRDNNTQAQVFWLKGRAGWSDKLEVGVSGEVEHTHSLDMVGLVRQLSPSGRASLKAVLQEVRTLRESEAIAAESLDVRALAAGGA